MGLGTMFHEIEKLSRKEQYPEFNVLVGQTIVNVEGLTEGSDEVIIATKEGNKYKLYHSQDCCESVSLYDLDGDTTDLIGGHVTIAEVVIGETPVGHVWDYEPESYTWPFYKIETSKGSVFMRWLGESNGYYGEEVTFKLIAKGGTHEINT